MITLTPHGTRDDEVPALSNHCNGSAHRADQRDPPLTLGASQTAKAGCKDELGDRLMALGGATVGIGSTDDSRSATPAAGSGRTVLGVG